MHARIDGRDINLLTRTGLGWSHRYQRTIEALANSEASLYRRRAQRTQYPTDQALLLGGPLVQPRQGERPIRLFKSLHTARKWLLEGGAQAAPLLRAARCTTVFEFGSKSPARHQRRLVALQ